MTRYILYEFTNFKEIIIIYNNNRYKKTCNKLNIYRNICIILLIK